jgi:hypothetical protein
MMIETVTAVRVLSSIAYKLLHAIHSDGMK